MLLVYFLLPSVGGSRSTEEGAALPNRRHSHPALEVVSAHLRMLRAASADPQGFARGADPGSAAHPAGPAAVRQRHRAGGWRLVPAGAARGAGLALQPLLGRARPRRTAAPGLVPQPRPAEAAPVPSRPRSRSRLTAAPLHLPAGPPAASAPPPQQPGKGARGARPPAPLGAASAAGCLPSAAPHGSTSTAPASPTRAAPSLSPHLTSPSPAHGPARPQLPPAAPPQPGAVALPPAPRAALTRRAAGLQPAERCRPCRRPRERRAGAGRGPARTAAAPRLTCSGRAEGGLAPQPPAPPRPRARAFPAVYGH